MHKLMRAHSIRNGHDDDISQDSFITARTDHLHVECHHSLDAILGTNLFRYRSPLYFGTFHTSLFTMFQVLSKPSWCVPACLYVCVSYLHMHECAYVSIHTCIFTRIFATWQVLSGDSWASAVARSIFAPDRTDADVAFFFVSYILIAAVMLLNVVVAVLLVITNARDFQIDVGQTSNGLLKSLVYDPGRVHPHCHGFSLLPPVQVHKRRAQHERSFVFAGMVHIAYA